MTDTGRPVGSGFRDAMFSHFEMPDGEVDGVDEGSVADGDELATPLESGDTGEVGAVAVGEDDSSGLDPHPAAPAAAQTAAHAIRTPMACRDGTPLPPLAVLAHMSRLYMARARPSARNLRADRQPLWAGGQHHGAVSVGAQIRHAVGGQQLEHLGGRVSKAVVAD